MAVFCIFSLAGPAVAVGSAAALSHCGLLFELLSVTFHRLSMQNVTRSFFDGDENEPLALTCRPFAFRAAVNQRSKAICRLGIRASYSHLSADYTFGRLPDRPIVRSPAGGR